MRFKYSAALQGLRPTPLKEIVYEGLRLLESSGGRPEPKEKSCWKMTLTALELRMCREKHSRLVP